MASLAKKLSVRLWTKWLWVRVQLQSRTLLSPATKAIKALVCSVTNPTLLQIKLKITSAAFPARAENASTTFPVSLPRTPASFFNHFFKAPSSFRWENPEIAGTLFHSKTASAVVEDGHKKSSKCWYYCNTLLTE